MIKIEHPQKSIGNRLKKIRFMTGLTRADLEKTYKINRSTLQAWENNRNPLSLENATKLASIFLTEGIICDIQWMLSGDGHPPTYANNNTASSEIKLSHGSLKSYNLTEGEKVIREISLFESHYKHTKVIVVSDDAMVPIYKQGDYVGGCIYPEEEWDSLVGQDVIASTYNNEIYFRKLLRSEENDFVLGALNYTSKACAPLIFPQNVTGLAPVTWHRKFFPITKK